jgi:hypothetical protein
MHATLDLPDGRRLAYHRAAGKAPGVVFLGGFRSDMTGTKATFLEAWARERGRRSCASTTAATAPPRATSSTAPSAAGRATRPTRWRG